MLLDDEKGVRESIHGGIRGRVTERERGRVREGKRWRERERGRKKTTFANSLDNASMQGTEREHVS